MSVAKYLIRLDDACPTMSQERWNAFEELFDEFSICPIVAVIPNNADPAMVIDSPDGNFWEKVRTWQNKGWEIALHGYTHKMRKTNVKQVLPFYDRSEFSGLSYYEQAQKISSGIDIFKQQSVETRIFVAPAHSFDYTTLNVLQNETKIEIVSDGIALNFYYVGKLIFIPQQLSRFSLKPFGLWTICLHPNSCDNTTFNELKIALKKYRQLFIRPNQLKFREKRYKSLLDRIYEIRFWYLKGKLFQYFACHSKRLQKECRRL